MTDSDIKNLSLQLAQLSLSLTNDLKTFKTGRANINILDHVKVTVYGTLLPLNQVASINVIDAHLIQITPYDANNLTDITETIRNDNNLNLNPIDDGHNIKLNIPPLTEERRKELVKIIRQKGQDYLIKIRQFRHDFLNKLSQAKNDKSLSEDEIKLKTKQIEDLINQQKNLIEEIITEKEKEIMTL